MRPNTIKDTVNDTIHCVFYSCKEGGTRTIKCGADERRRRRLDGAEPISALCVDATESLPMYPWRIQQNGLHISNEIIIVRIKLRIYCKIPAL